MSACRGASADPFGGAVRSRTAFQQLGHAVAGLGRDVQHLRRLDPEDALNLLRAAVRLGRGQVDLVDHGHHVEVALHRQVSSWPRVWASMPWAASTTRITDSQAASERLTS